MIVIHGPKSAISQTIYSQMKNQLLSLSFGAALVVGLTSCDKSPPGMTIVGGGSGTSDQNSASTPPPAVTPTIVKAPETTPPVASTPPTPSPAPAPTPANPTPAPTGPSVAVKPKMPQPLFAGTPLPADNTIPNLDPAGTPAVLSVDLPEGVTLISAKAKVTSSDTAPFTGTLDLVTDGEKDGSDGFYVELAPGKQWVQIDLGSEKEIWGMWVWHFHKSAFVYKGVVVQASNDAEFKTATTLYNNDYDNSVGLGVGKDNSYVETNNGRYMAGKGTKARYVRLWSNGRYLDEMNHYIEVEVYGK